jgi:DNA repair exonuclease SbcCD ATPase subunit
MNNSILSFRTQLERAKGQLIQLESSITTLQEDLKENKRSLIRHEKAHVIVREVGIKVQQQLQYHISDITSLALEAVFNDPYNLTVEFVQRRNKTECDLYFVRRDEKVDPISASGGGAVDVASFALRVASWSMSNPKTRNTILLDEPFKHLKGVEENHKVLQMINEISKKMGLQIIMISDERIPREDIIDLADRVFEVTIKNGRSKVEII